MITIGIRAAPGAVTFAIYDQGRDAVVNLDEIVIPIALDVPDALKYLRCHLLDVLREYEVTHAGIRATEPSADRPSKARIEIEGVIKESFASSDLEAYYVGHASSIMARLGLPRTDFKLFIDGSKDPQIENWVTTSVNEREAILCAKGAVNA